MTFTYQQRKKKKHKKYSHGMLLYWKHQYKEAISFLMEEYKEKNDVRTYFCIGKCYSEIRDYDKAKEIFSEIIRKDTTDKYAHMELGRIFKRQGKQKEAEEEFNKYIKIDKDEFPHAHLELGKLFKEQGKLKEAEEEFNKYIKVDKDITPHGHFELGKLYKEQGKLKEAEEEFNKYIKIDKDESPHAHLELGRLFKEQGKLKEAEEEFNKYIKIDKDESPHAHLELGKLFKEQGKLKEAEEEFNKYIKVDKDITPHGHFELGKLYKEQGKIKEAEEEFKKVIEIDKDMSAHGHLELGMLYSQQQNDKKAEEMYKRLLKNIGQDKFNLKNRYIHIRKHFSDDLSKEIHGVFRVDYLPLLNNLKELMSNGKYHLYRGYNADIFIMKMENCGYSGGKKGDKHILNYITIIMFPYSDNILTLYPSDGTEEIGDQIKKEVYTKDNIRSVIEKVDLSIVQRVNSCLNKLIAMETRG